MPYCPDPKLEAFLRDLPKTENHLYIEGALPFDLLCDLHPEKYKMRPDSWTDDYKFRNFQHFETELLGYAEDWFTSVDRYQAAASVIFERLQSEQNVHYVETSFASGCIDFMNLSGDQVAEAIQSVAQNGMTVKVFMGIHHDGYTEKTSDFIDKSLDWDAFDGIDLHGNELIPVDNWAKSFWEKARSKGKLTKAHDDK